jgi:hypothetical protein
MSVKWSPADGEGAIGLRGIFCDRRERVTGDVRMDQGAACDCGHLLDGRHAESAAAVLFRNGQFSESERPLAGAFVPGGRRPGTRIVVHAEAVGKSNSGGEVSWIRRLDLSDSASWVPPSPATLLIEDGG